MNRFVGLSSKERHEYFIETGANMNLSPNIVEKDFWVCWVLEKLFAMHELSDSLIFKGGTSLSKAYRLIERFSEDIDISIDRATLGFGNEDNDPEADVGSNERQRRIKRLGEACCEVINNIVIPEIKTLIEKELGTCDGWSVLVDEDDPDLQTILYYYPTVAASGPGAYMKPAVRIEMGARSDNWPSETVDIASYVAQHFSGAFDAPVFPVKVLAPERTFWEKATLLHAEYHRPQAKTAPNRLSRHYYDMARLIQAGLGEKAVAGIELLHRVIQHKNIFFRSGWASYDTARQGTLRLAPNLERMESLKADYENMKDMFFGSRPDFPSIVDILANWQNRFNDPG